MVPPRLVRRLVLAPIVVVIAIALAVLFPALAVVAAVLGLVHLSRPGRMRGLRVLWFAVVWLTGETAALFALLGLWLASGFGGRMRTEPFQARNGALVIAPGGRVEIVLAFSYRDDRISGIEVIADAGRLDGLELAVLG